MDTTYDSRTAETRSPWGAVICMSLMTFTLVASEFMPVSLLTPIAEDLAITEGQAGMAIAVSGFFAVVDQPVQQRAAGAAGPPHGRPRLHGGARHLRDRRRVRAQLSHLHVRPRADRRVGRRLLVAGDRHRRPHRRRPGRAEGAGHAAGRNRARRRHRRAAGQLSRRPDRLARRLLHPGPGRRRRVRLAGARPAPDAGRRDRLHRGGLPPACATAPSRSAWRR